MFCLVSGASVAPRGSRKLHSKFAGGVPESEDDCFRDRRAGREQAQVPAVHSTLATPSREGSSPGNPQGSEAQSSTGSCPERNPCPSSTPLLTTSTLCPSAHPVAKRPGFFPVQRWPFPGPRGPCASPGRAGVIARISSGDPCLGQVSKDPRRTQASGHHQGPTLGGCGRNF